MSAFLTNAHIRQLANSPALQFCGFSVKYLCATMPGRIPFTFNTMVLLPLLRSLPAASVASVVATLVSMTGLDFGRLHLGRPDTAADQLVAFVMAFIGCVLGFWALFCCVNAYNWAVGFAQYHLGGRQRPKA